MPSTKAGKPLGNKLWEMQIVTLPGFLFPALVYFFLLVIYPIFGSFWISFHDWNGTTFQCSDGRSLLELNEDESCRRVPVMTWVGLENYERFFKKTLEILNVLKTTG